MKISPCFHFPVTTVLFCLNISVFAQESVPESSPGVVEIVITAVQDTSEVRTEDSLVAPPDTAALLKKMPGADVNKNGELTGIAQYRGMYGDRVNITVDGNSISSGGPNAMDAPLHYAPVALMESLTIQRGIVPVSAGQETIGGHIEAQAFKGEFGATQALNFGARLYAGTQTVNDGSVTSGLFTLSNNKHLIRASLMREEGDDSDYAGGTITPSSYKRDRFDIGYSIRQGNHSFSLDIAANQTGDAGTAALPMDILSVDSDLIHARYQWQGFEKNIVVRLSNNNVEHWMTNFHLRRPPQDNMMTTGKMRYRQTFAEGKNTAFLVGFEQETDNGLWRLGVDGHYADHAATITNPNASMFFIENFKDVSRDVTGFYAETKLSLGTRTGLEAGIRFNHVEMGAGAVSSNLNPMNMGMGMPVMMANMANSLSTDFNNSELLQSDENVDWFARLSVEFGRDITWYAGAARKTRSPSYQERYLWLPMEATGGLADGITYVGNVALQPEVGHELEVGFDWDARGFTFYPRLYYKNVSDYIQGVPVTAMPVLGFSQMMVNMGMGSGTPLQFANVDAGFIGFDVESRLDLNGRFALRSNLSVVRGKRDDINDDLYRISPDNISLALDYETANWMASVEAIAYARQDRISVTNRERETGGYMLLNTSVNLNLNDNMDIGLGVNNLFDKYHQDHLAGYNRAYNADLAMRDRLPGLGRNIYGRLIWRF